MVPACVEADMMRAAALLTGAVLVLAACSGPDAPEEVTRSPIPSPPIPSPPIPSPPVPSAPDPSPGDPAWTALADAPLTPRAQSVGVWTGDELIVAGGVSWHCPPGADCRGPIAEEVLLDAAAYDPVADTWRLLPDLPRATFFDTAHWTGEEMLVVHRPLRLEAGAAPATDLPAAVSALDPVTGVWRALDPPPEDGFSHSLWTGDHLVLWSGDDEFGETIQTLDPRTGEWDLLPEDPLGPSFDRGLAWLDDRFYLAALREDDDRRPREFVLTTLDPAVGEWTEPEPTPVTFWGQEWWAFDGHLVNASQEVSGPAPATVSGALDPATGEWRDVPQLDDRAEWESGCRLPAIGPAGNWLVPGHGVLLSLDPAAAIVAPPCPDLSEPSVGVWTGSEILVWGGLGEAGLTNSRDGFRWTPPSPSGAS